MKLWSQFYPNAQGEAPPTRRSRRTSCSCAPALSASSAAGLYTYMPLGLRAIQKITQICREELDGAGAIELWMPHVHPVEFWQDGPRWAAAREIMFRADHAGDGKRQPATEFVLRPTHEEIITPLVKTEITSYRDLPKNFYQIATKFRNEIRRASG